MDWKSGRAESSASGLPIGCNQGLGWDVVISRFKWGRIHFQVHAVVGWIKFLTGCWIEGLSSSLVVDQGSHSLSCHIRSVRSGSSLLHESMHGEQAMERFCLFHSLWNSVMKVHHFCNILLVSIKSFQGTGLHTSKYQEVGVNLGAILEVGATRWQYRLLRTHLPPLRS